MGVKEFSLYATPPHDCSYLDGRQATTVFVDPYVPIDVNLYQSLAIHGFRRSGEYLYRPQCEHCQACIAVRLPVNEFKPRRTQKRVWNKNQDLKATVQPAVFKQEHFTLYSRYLASRHKDAGMDNPTPTEYLEFLASSWSKTFFYEIRLENQLLAIAVVDVFENGLSAVYTFFDPDYNQRSLGVYAILFEIDLAKKLGLEYLYLGYWIADCRKMAYKIDYQPLEYYVGDEWQKQPPNIAI
ncbi:arginyltransferase [Candidatus Albibeggiatoa sp. nov. NOAA]|uniref:arginyltransferase n=1 Tax=Candidatus Albibeggiatoa sp. nov. NOAA TaxID=3162724 RepID=UPI003303C8B9|nr:arginyltransferase [Thiotrichaceae bacterium]